jgi:hypothetical protein
MRQRPPLNLHAQLSGEATRNIGYGIKENTRKTEKKYHYQQYP